VIQRTLGMVRAKLKDSRAQPETRAKTVAPPRARRLEMKFGMQRHGGPRRHAFQTVKESILSYIQRTKKDSNDMVFFLDKDEIVDLTAVKPRLQILQETNNKANANKQKAFDKEFEGELED
jgi:hypothetical protein